MTLILRRDTHAPQPSEITPRAVWQDRRRLLAGAAAAAAGAASPLGALAAAAPAPGMIAPPGKLARLADVRSTVAGAYVLDKPTPYDLVTTYNNFYEFSTDKAEPARLAGTLRPRPWSVVVDGEVHKPRTFALEDLMKLAPMEERIYRHRCVEGWSMVIPWVGWSLSTLLKAVEPTGNARYVKFTTLDDPKQMPGIRDGVLDWPYVEGLRMDEAMHPLALMAFGLYGEVLPNQNGAPVRMVVPWKYGFKSAKSIVRVSLVEKQPLCSWPESAPNEYGFYSNVNPHVDHPRWSQATERRIGESGGFGGLFAPRHPTLMFNGYEPEVGQLYAGMNLRRYF